MDEVFAKYWGAGADWSKEEYLKRIKSEKKIVVVLNRLSENCDQEYLTVFGFGESQPGRL